MILRFFEACFRWLLAVDGNHRSTTSGAASAAQGFVLASRTRIENAELIDFSGRSKLSAFRETCQTGTYLERDFFHFRPEMKSGYYQVVTGKSETLNLEGNRTARERFRLWVTGREYPELTLPFNAVRCEVCMINGKNYGKKFTLRKVHQGAIGKIHGAIPIARHQTVHML